MEQKKADAQLRTMWMMSFLFRSISFRFLLTPLGTTRRQYNIGSGTIDYLDVYVFGIRIARLHTKA
jgi:hypothetical protein